MPHFMFFSQDMWPLKSRSQTFIAIDNVIMVMATCMNLRETPRWENNTFLMWLPYSALLDYWRDGEELSSLPLTLAANMPKNHHQLLLSLPATIVLNSWPPKNASPRTKTVCLFGTIIVGCYRHIVTTHPCQPHESNKTERTRSVQEVAHLGPAGRLPALIWRRK